ncbi:hypothetical protein IGI04_002361 [Brassica rapa subsp. trilocularis]|uniref:Uncharacterized protein n=1 Tax=Brassica rapa subsp. trilocularis TaxID=1813537 RepID=A0ABQ7NYN0_BRACM|nr:hypothetical protein IGI04_002361 [Brassica rapa subsp. trilocularis]
MTKTDGVDLWLESLCRFSKIIADSAAAHSLSFCPLAQRSVDKTTGRLSPREDYFKSFELSEQLVYNQLISISLIHLFFFVGLVSLEAAAATSFSLGSRLILRDIGSNVIADQKDNAVELNAINFDLVFEDTSAKFAVLEFFAHWLVFSLESIWRKKVLIFRLDMLPSPEIYQEIV